MYLKLLCSIGLKPKELITWGDDKWLHQGSNSKTSELNFIVRKDKRNQY